MNKGITLIVLSILVLLVVNNCEEYIPKKRGLVRLEYPESKYKTWLSTCGFSAKISDQIKIISKDSCWFDLQYPKMRAVIYITYHSVNNNYSDLRKEIEKFTYKHTIRANDIFNQDYIEYSKKVYARIFDVSGPVATFIQFYATDSLNHMLSGSLYFYTKSNQDSLQPAIDYIRKDIVKLIETLQWSDM